MDVDCADVLLFHRVQQMMKVTSNALRQQITNREGNVGHAQLMQRLSNEL